MISYLYKKIVSWYNMNFKKLFLFLSFFQHAYFFRLLFSQNRGVCQLYMRKTKKNELINYHPKNENQKKYVTYLNDNTNKIIISIGPAGTGKTMFACQKAINQLKKEEINKIIITRPVITVEEELGFLPGNILKKMDPWTKPIFDIFLEYISKTDLDVFLLSNKIEICPLAFMRGRTFKHALIIADEMQNSSPNQMKMLTTRMGDDCRMVITGDLKQTDIKSENGLHDFVMKWKTYELQQKGSELIKMVEFDNKDIERSEIVREVMRIYDPLLENPLLENPLLENPLLEKVEQNKEQKGGVIVEPGFPIKKDEQKGGVIGEHGFPIKKDDSKKDERDCALIPKRYRSHNYDIFFGENEI